MSINKKNIFIQIKEKQKGLGQDRAAYHIYDNKVVGIFIADGVGGSANGALAAEYFIDFFKEKKIETDFTYLPAQLFDFFETLDREIKDNIDGGECTGVALFIADSYCVGCSVGDSEAWVFSNTEQKNLTQNQIQKPFLGSGGAQPIVFHDQNARGTVVVGTDGFFKYVSKSKLFKLNYDKDINDIVNDVINLTKETLTPDDLSFVLLKN